MLDEMEITLQIFVDGVWRDAAFVGIQAPVAGHLGPTHVSYDIGYVADHDPDLQGGQRDAKALGVRFPLSAGMRRFQGWPPPLLDLLPQGHARTVVREALGLRGKDGEGADLDILLRAAGAPIGNVRVKEAAEAEAMRITASAVRGFKIEDIAAHHEEFLEAAREFGAAVSGSSGVQGTWPKALMTQAQDGLWYPDPVVSDEQALRHVIIKWAGDQEDESRLILDAEAAYLELARDFGLRCAKALHRRGNVLVIPRFDRSVVEGRTVRFGQESIVSASDIAAFGHEDAHETYLGTIKAVSTNPAADVEEYVLRDVLNLALGNPDNHGRNTAFQKDAQGSVRLTPLFDFTPMRMATSGIRRSTKWTCMVRNGGRFGDLDPDWGIVCDVAAEGVMRAEDLKASLVGRVDALRRMPENARALGVPERVIEHAMARCSDIADGLTELRRKAHHAPRW